MQSFRASAFISSCRSRAPANAIGTTTFIDLRLMQESCKIPLSSNLTAKSFVWSSHKAQHDVGEVMEAESIQTYIAVGLACQLHCRLRNIDLEWIGSTQACYVCITWGVQVFLSHLHTDHIDDLTGLYGLESGRPGPLQVWGPSGQVNSPAPLRAGLRGEPSQLAQNANKYPKYPATGGICQCCGPTSLAARKN